MINEIIDKELYSFYDEIDSWEDAIYKSCDSLIAKDIVDLSYPKKII